MPAAGNSDRNIRSFSLYTATAHANRVQTLLKYRMKPTLLPPEFSYLLWICSGIAIAD